MSSTIEALLFAVGSEGLSKEELTLDAQAINADAVFEKIN